MATLIHADGSKKEVFPRDRTQGFTLEELNLLFDCATVEAIKLGEEGSSIFQELFEQLSRMYPQAVRPADPAAILACSECQGSQFHAARPDPFSDLWQVCCLSCGAVYALLPSGEVLRYRSGERRSDARQ